MEPSIDPPSENKAAASQQRARPRGILRKLVLVGRDLLIRLRLFFLRKILKADIHPTAKLSLKARIDFTNPRGIHIGAGTYVAFNAVVLSHDMSRLLHLDTYIGKNCFVGASSIVLPGVRVGNECIVGSGSVVTRDVPDHSIVVGNPARVIRSGIRTREWGILEEVYNKIVAEESDLRSRS